MATNRKTVIQLAIGGFILVLMLVVASFSLGVYVGEHGWTRAGLQYTGGPPQAGGQGQPGPGGKSQPGGQPQALPGLPMGPPAVVGRIRMINANGLELATQDGPRFVQLSDNTRFQDDQGKPMQLTDLNMGDVVAVFGRFVGGDGGQLQAEVIVRLPPG